MLLHADLKQFDAVYQVIKHDSLISVLSIGCPPDLPS